jgi:XTP/dITP diphosphohydrolase
VGGLTAFLCSLNEHKLRELQRVLTSWTLELLPAADYPPETGATYYDNARAKAQFGRAVAPPDSWVLGEDSGIEVEALSGGPGVYTARFGRDDPVARMLAALEGVEREGRRARYVCELVALAPDGTEHRGTGVLNGHVATEAAGTEGFGYDPIFVPDSETKTVAELGDDWKAEGNSHRARAASALAATLG